MKEGERRLEKIKKEKDEERVNQCGKEGKEGEGERVGGEVEEEGEDWREVACESYI